MRHEFDSSQTCNYCGIAAEATNESSECAARNQQDLYARLVREKEKTVHELESVLAKKLAGTLNDWADAQAQQQVRQDVIWNAQVNALSILLGDAYALKHGIVPGTAWPLAGMFQMMLAACVEFLQLFKLEQSKKDKANEPS